MYQPMLHFKFQYVNIWSFCNIKQAREGLNTFVGKTSKKWESPGNNSQDFIDELDQFFLIGMLLWMTNGECDGICNNLPTKSLFY